MDYKEENEDLKQRMLQAFNIITWLAEDFRETANELETVAHELLRLDDEDMFVNRKPPVLKKRPHVKRLEAFDEFLNILGDNAQYQDETEENED